MTAPQIVSFHGPKGCGKSTAAKVFGSAVLRRNPQAQIQRHPFAGPLKSMLRAGLHLTRDQTSGRAKEIVDPRYGVTPRRMMQTLGTEWGRELIRDDLWVLAWEAGISPHTDVIVVDDCRFANEAEALAELGATFIGIRRDGVDWDPSHESERAAAAVYAEYTHTIIPNNGTVDELRNAMAALAEELIHGA